MDAQHEHNCNVLRDRFEGREAIYVEKGALRVRFTNIRIDGFQIAADVEEIITPGLGVGLFTRRHPPVTPPYRWNINIDFSACSDQTWCNRYPSWIAYFDSNIVQAVIELGAQLPANADPIESYYELTASLKTLTA